MAIRLIFVALLLIGCAPKAPDLIFTKELDGERIFKSRCAACHGEFGTRSPMKGVLVASQSEEMAKRALSLYRIGKLDNHRGGVVMRSQARNLSDDHILALAKHIGTLHEKHISSASSDSSSSK